MGYEADYLHKHGWRLSGSEMHHCRRVPLWKKPGVVGMFTTQQAYERQRDGKTSELGEIQANAPQRHVAPPTV